MWTTFSGCPIEDLFDEIERLTREFEAASAEFEIHIGTDSQLSSQGTDFVTAVCLRQPGHGGRVYTCRSSEDRDLHLSHKLILEAERSLEVARELDPRLSSRIFVHVDANLDPRHRSSTYAGTLSGMVLGHGFEVKLKPDSWCATHVADHCVRNTRRDAA